MYGIIFEVWPHASGRDRYFELAAKLKRLLVQQPGFISVERFESLMEEGKLLSLSFWESEQAIVNWRSQLDHIEAQKEGKEKLFERYRIRVVKIERDYSFSADTP